MLTVNVPVNVTFELILNAEEEDKKRHVLFMNIHYVSPFLKTEKLIHVNYRRIPTSLTNEELTKYCEETLADMKNVEEVKQIAKIMLYGRLMDEYKESGVIQSTQLRELSEAANMTMYQFDVPVELDVE